MEKQELLDKVLGQVMKDIEIGDVTALEILLSVIPDDLLEDYIA